MVNKESLLSVIKKSKKPMRFGEILNLSGADRYGAKKVQRLLNDLIKEGEVVHTRGGLYGPVLKMSLITGYFEAHKEGYGFVIPEKTGEADLFVPPGASLGAMTYDRVIARTENTEKREARIVRILKRAHTKIAGRLDVTKTACYVMPKNKSLSFDIYISPKDRAGAKAGDTVIAEISAYPSPGRQASGKIVKVLKKPEDPHSEIEAIIEELDIPKRFSREIHLDAKSMDEKDLGRRKDLTGLPAVTIDGERAKDFDDAVSIRLAGHGYTLYVHIADVGHYVDWDGPLDMEARQRGTSIYFADRVIPMLPPDLSEDLCSLKPHVPRPAFTVQMDFDRSGQKLDARFYPSLIISTERMTYTSVRKILVDMDEKERGKYGHLLKEFELMAELASALRDKRRKRGSLDFDLPEPEVILDLTGRPEAILRAERNFAHIIIEEFMIAANEAVAEHLQDKGAPCLYRVHEPPEPFKMEQLGSLIRPLLKSRTASSGGGKRFKPEMLQAVINDSKGTPAEEVINYIVLRSLKKARYSPENVGHFGLASKCYAHFTSPIRRYPDLVVHRILREVLNKKSLSDKRLKELQETLPGIAAHSSYMERRSDEAEKEVVNAMRVWFMKDKVGEEYKGRVVGVTPYGIKIRLDDFYVDGFLHVSFMTDDFYVYDEGSLMLRGRNTKRTFKIGQGLAVRIDRVDMEEREVVFGLA